MKRVAAADQDSESKHRKVDGSAPPEEEEEEEIFDPSRLPLIEKDYSVKNAWEVKKEDIVVCDNNGKPDIYIVKDIPGKVGMKGRGSPSLRLPPGRCVLTSVDGEGRKQKLGKDLEYGVLLTPTVAPGAETNADVVARVSSEWEKTFQVLDWMKEKLCEYISKIPNCQLQCYTAAAAIISSSLTPDETEMLAGKKKRTKAFSEKYTQKMYEQLMSSCQVHHGKTSKYTEKLDSPNGIINRWYMNSSSKSYRLISADERDKPFELIYPTLGSILAARNQGDPRYEMAQHVQAMFNLPPEKENGKLVEKRAKLVPLRVYKQEPIYLPDGRVKRDSSGRPILQSTKFDLFDRRITNQDIVQIEFFGGAWFYGGGLGILSKLSSAHVLIPRPHEEYNQDVPETSYSTEWAPKYEDRPAQNGGGLHALPPVVYHGNNNNNANPNDPDDYSHAYGGDMGDSA